MRRFARVVAATGLGFLVAAACEPTPGSPDDVGVLDRDSVPPPDAAACGELSPERCEESARCLRRCDRCVSAEAVADGVGCKVPDANTDVDEPSNDADTPSSDAGTADAAPTDSSEHFEWIRYADRSGGRAAYEDLEIGPEGGLFAAGIGHPGPEAPAESPPLVGIVVKYDDEGRVAWRYRVDAPAESRITAVATFGEGGVVAVGSHEAESSGIDEDQPEPPGTFVLTLDKDGERTSRFDILDEGDPRLEDVVFVDGDPVVVGDDDAEHYGRTVGDNRDALVARIEFESLGRQWLRFFGGDGVDRAQSVVKKGSSSQLLVPVHENTEMDSPGDGRLYSLGPDGETDEGNTLPLNSSSELPHATLQDGAILFAGWAKGEAPPTDAAAAGGTPVYPTSSFDQSFGSERFDVATDIAAADSVGAWLVGRWNHRGEGPEAGFASRVVEGADLGADVVFGDTNPARVDPRAVAVDGEGGVYVAGTTRFAFGKSSTFESSARFVGRLLPESGP